VSQANLVVEIGLTLPIVKTPENFVKSNFAAVVKALIINWILPPGITLLLTKVRERSATHDLSDEPDPLDQYVGEEWFLFREALDGASSYLEFGSGLSTEYVSLKYECQARSIETSAEWVQHVQNRVRPDIAVLHVDLGPVGEWGRPLTYDYQSQFIRYFEAGFDQGFEPDAVLIDGRFRVACFLTTLLLSKPGTRIVIDDYTARPQYKVVEQILSPVTVSSRQALFIRPDKIQNEKIRNLRDQFVNVMD
jgi:hypothetical protein